MPQGNFDFTSKPWPERKLITDKEKLLQKLAYMHKHHPNDGYGKIGDAITQGNYKAANAAAMNIYKNTHGQINYVPDVNAVFGKA